MATLWGTDDQKADNSELHGYEWNHEVRCSATQVNGALYGLKPGVIEGLEVTRASDTTVTVAPGAAIVESSAYGLIFVRTVASTTLNIDDADAFPEVESGDNYILAGVIIADEPDAVDSRENGIIQFSIGPDDDVDATLPLAKVTYTSGVLATTVTDVRTFYEIAALRNLITALQASVTDVEAVIGYPYDVTALGSLQTRLHNLETGVGTGEDDDGSGPVAITYLSQLKWSSTDTRSATVVIEEKLEALRTDLEKLINDGGRRPRQTRLDQVMHELAITRQTTIKLSPIDGERSRAANVLRTVEGIYGDGTHSHPDYIDTDLTINDDGTIEP